MSSGDFSFLKGNIYTIILCALYSKDENAGKYGYEIVREIKDRTENKYEIKQPTLYSYLKKLEQQGLIESFWGTESNGGRRRYYRLTPQGRHDCAQFIAEWEYHKDVLSTLVTDASDVEVKVTQDTATPLFGGRRKRSKSGNLTEEINAQDEISRRLDALFNTSDDAVSTDDIGVKLPADAEPQIKNEVSTEEYVYESAYNDSAQLTEELETPEDTGIPQAEEEFSDVAISEYEVEQPVVEKDYEVPLSPYNQQSEEEHKAKFDVRQDNADEFLHRFEERARSLAESREEQHPDNNENYQHVLMNVIGNQLDEMKDYNSEQNDGAQKYYTDHPIALEDVADGLAKEGIRMRIYNQTSSNYKSKTLMPISGVLCKSAWITFAVVAVYFCVLTFTSIANNNWRPFVITLGIIAVLPLALTVWAWQDPSRKEKPIFQFKRYLIATGILAAIIVLASLGISIISGIELNSYIAVSSQILLPLGIAVMLPLYVVVFYQFYKKY